MLPGVSEHIEDLRRSTSNSLRRVTDIDNEISESTITDYQRSLLMQERSALLKNVEATIADLKEFQTLSQSI